MNRRLLLVAGLALAACGKGRFTEAGPSATLPDVRGPSSASDAAAGASVTKVAVGDPLTESSGPGSTVPTSDTTAFSSSGWVGPRVSSAGSAATVAASSEPTSALDTTSSEATSTGASKGYDSSEHAGDDSLDALAAGFHEIEIHDECTDDDPADDVCAHEREHEVMFTFGGQPDTTYAVKLRIRGLFEPTHIKGGATPDSEHPYFKLGGNVTNRDYSQWKIDVTKPSAIYYLNHYPQVGQVIYQQDFEATITVRGGAEVRVGVEDGNERQIDNGYLGSPDRQQTIDGVTNGIPNGQYLRIDVLDVSVSP